MKLPLSRRVAPDLQFLAETGSTNAELVRQASTGSLADFTVVATTSQTTGRGRLDRVWVAPPGRTIAVSVLLKPGAVPMQRLGWMPLMAGLAMTRAVASLVQGPAVTLKWPNDVLVDSLKVSGLLAELLPGAAGVVVGAGLNLTMSADELPTSTSTSLTLVGAAKADIVDRALAAYLGQLRQSYDEFASTGFDPEAGLRGEVQAGCDTIGRPVRVELPGAPDLHGTAEGIDDLGRLQVRRDGELLSVAAGDVTHLRYE
ncbi:MAG: biotin--[acetyl-CoA-carboxylase] ligase [Rhodoglobus sp.]|nr:biotin--[acetyl-CoA-carboxylase] ligase [Rhodoglobus sp.]